MNVNSISDDQRFKQLLEAFFADFLRLFDPATAARLDLSKISFRSGEVFTDIPQGERRTADVVAEIATLAGDPELIVVHAEIQRQRKVNFPYRMFEYYTLLRQREQKPVIPIALVFYSGREGIAVEEYEEIVFGQRILTFRYLQISLPLLPAEEYARAESVLGAGLACVMRLPRDRDAQIALRAACLQRVLDAVAIGQVDAARAFMLGALIETYLPLNAREREELRVQLEQEGETTMGATQLTWADELMLRNKLQTMREAIKDVIAFKFGEVPSDVDAAIDSASTEQELTALLQRAAVARTQDDWLRTSP